VLAVVKQNKKQTMGHQNVTQPLTTMPNRQTQMPQMLMTLRIQWI
jgi:hypothetical protein